MRNKAQSTVEYILLVTAVITVGIMITTGTNGNNSIFKQRLGNAINLTTDGMQNMAGRLANIAALP